MLSNEKLELSDDADKTQAIESSGTSGIWL